MCGSSATFQGQERDIVFLSMVACPQTAMSQAQRMYEQRFNVAASRARDRLILVRSVSTSDLKPGDLKLALIEHFRSPMESGKVIRPGELLDLCDSDFERDFGRCLLDLGYRLKPQVPVGGYRIDFVIEGADDRRLAIELDGDKYHGPDRWAEDVRRQKAMERLGWTFWRCWGSAWISDQQGCLDDLKATLTRLGIEPLGMAPVDGVYTLHVEVPPPTPSTPISEEVTAKAGFAEAEMPIVLPDGTPTGPVGLGYQVVTDTISEPVIGDMTGAIAEVGDLVTVRYNAEPDRPIRFRLSQTENRPGEGIVHISQPLASSVLGASVDDVIRVEIGGRKKKAVIERIEKASTQGAR
jgi:very-short-patch-repair endonuclease